jgi:hypothetical protein
LITNDITIKFQCAYETTVTDIAKDAEVVSTDYVGGQNGNGTFSLSLVMYDDEEFSVIQENPLSFWLL